MSELHTLGDIIPNDLAPQQADLAETSTTTSADDTAALAGSDEPVTELHDDYATSTQVQEVLADQAPVADQRDDSPADVDADDDRPRRHARGLVDPKSRKEKKPAAPVRPAFARPTSSFGALADLRSRLIIPAEDGINCINTLGSAASTQLGKLLSLEAKTTFDHPELGRFASMSAFALFISLEEPDEQVRLFTGKDAYLYTKNQNPRRRRVDGEALVLADALWIKVNVTPGLKELIIGNDLPLRHYYINEGQTPVDTRESQWLIPAYRIIAATLKKNARTGENEAPNFDSLIVPERAPRRR